MYSAHLVQQALICGPVPQNPGQLLRYFHVQVFLQYQNCYRLHRSITVSCEIVKAMELQINRRCYEDNSRQVFIEQLSLEQLKVYFVVPFSNCIIVKNKEISCLKILRKSYSTKIPASKPKRNRGKTYVKKPDTSLKCLVCKHEKYYVNMQFSAKNKPFYTTILSAPGKIK